ncbi:hypothetical protein BJ138DRAFT_666269 [Hygrophoropsis aurantiaca]|uniref:Uncharacterized protein n=1 Tax=Hygrophoropsis aurantiaca TaxID=72124 RepID=A0ACB7ZYG0_9AGAM|nr:hypothetical protein BJ138DRAFT_666269 [Hygrophoropsis aurantiaca]
MAAFLSPPSPRTRSSAPQTTTASCSSGRCSLCKSFALAGRLNLILNLGRWLWAGRTGLLSRRSGTQFTCEALTGHNFNPIDGPHANAAQGVIDAMFPRAAEQLRVKSAVINTMAQMHAADASIQRARQSTPVLSFNWEATRIKISAGVCRTAYRTAAIGIGITVGLHATRG